LHENARLPTEPPTTRSVEDLLHEADHDYERRAEPGRAEEAEKLYLQAAAADGHRVEGLLGAMAALSYRIERGDPDKAGLAQRATELGQLCVAHAPESGACDYRLAIALGEVAREKKRTALDALKRMVDVLHQAIANDPTLDHAGPHRVLGLVLLRAPGWPAGPGDPEAGLQEARAAVALFPDAAENQLALAEALQKNEKAVAAHQAFERAYALARALDPAKVPEAKGFMDEAQKGLSRGGGR
jgi:tetratricopeptide (TPR) repeat protein